MTTILQSRQITTELRVLVVSDLSEWLRYTRNSASRFPGVVVLRHNTVALAIGFSVDAGGHCTATLPICAQPRDEQNTALAVLGYSELAAFSAAQNHRSLRCLIDMNCEQQTRELLAACEWKLVATIVRWGRTIPVHAGSDVDASQSGSNSFFIRKINVHELDVDALLNETLLESDDLPPEMRPRPLELVQNWDALESGYQADGLFECSGTSELAGLIVSSAASEGQQINIEYLGVRPQFRRRGIARMLIQHCMTQRAAGSLMTAYADAANGAANKLYEGLGFRPDGRWMLFLWQ